MPYYTHTADQEPENGTPYTTRVEAYASLSGDDSVDTSPDAPPLRVAFVITARESHDWKRREFNRLKDHTYTLPPWVESPDTLWSPSDSEWANYGQLKPVATHFAHLSLKQPGQIAYTPSDEHGYQDKQTTIKTGRYLEKYLSETFTREQIAEFVDRVKAYTGAFSLTTKTDEIEAIYTNNPSMRSCMSRKAHRYLCAPHHPSAAYAESPDVALAYLGTLDHPTARCIVWPDKREYTRVYGDTALEACLRHHGWTKRGSSDYGSLEGARLRAIEVSRGVYVMPYVDSASSADLSECGKYLVLRYGTGGQFDTRITHESGDDTLPTGLTIEAEDEDEDSHECENCSTRVSEHERYCEDCYGDLYSCSRCDSDGFDSSDFQEVDGDTYCTSCASRWEQTCPVCDSTWFAKDPDSEFCSRHEHYSRCAECDDPSTDLDRDDHCTSCAERLAEDEDETEIVATDDTETISLPLTDGTSDPTVSTTFHVKGYDDQTHPVTILYTVGVFIVHASISQVYGNPPYTVTHTPSGLSVIRGHSVDDCIVFASELATPGIDWSATTADTLPPEAKACYLRVRDLARSTYRTYPAPIPGAQSSLLSSPEVSR